MNVKMQVWSFGEQSFTSPKNGRVYNRATLMGLVSDPFTQETFPALAVLAYDAPALSESPKKDSFYLLDCSEMAVRNAMLTFTFASLRPFTESKGK